MRDTLEDLYFGKITPNEQDITPGSVLADAMDRAEQCEEKLTARLEGEEKTLLLRLLNAENEIGWRERRKPCSCGSSTRRTKSAVLWPWKIISWDFALE